MAEFGLIAGVVGVAGAAVASSKALFQMVDEVRNASVEITAVSKDTHAFHAVMSSVLLAVRNSKVVAILQQDEELCGAVVNLTEPLQNCAAVLKQLQGMIEPHLKSTNDGGYRISSTDLRWMFSKRKEVMDCRTRLESTKSTLDIALACINITCSLRSAGKDAVPPSGFDITIPDRDFDAGSVLLEYADCSRRSSRSSPDMTPPPSPQMKRRRYRYNSDSDDELSIVPESEKPSARPPEGSLSHWRPDHHLRHNCGNPELSPTRSPLMTSTELLRRQIQKRKLETSQNPKKHPVDPVKFRQAHRRRSQPAITQLRGATLGDSEPAAS